MKTTIITTISLVILMIGAPAVYAKTSCFHDCFYAKGFKTGYDDAINGRYDKNAYDPDTTLAEGYFAGWHQGCLDSGRSDCTH